MTVERQTMEVDIACVGFGPAMGGFLTTLSRALVDENGQPLLESGVMPGMPLQVLCYERADDISFGVSGVVTRARSIRASFPELDPAEIPMAAPVSDEKVLYLLDPHRRQPPLLRRSRPWTRLVGAFSGENHAFELPYIPPFLHKEDGLVLSIGQFNQWVGNAADGLRSGADLARHAGQRAAASKETGSSASGWRTRGRTGTALPPPASCPAWISAPL